MSLYGDVVVRTEDAVLGAARQTQDFGLSAVASMAKVGERLPGGRYATGGGEELAAKGADLGDAYLDAVIQFQDLTISALGRLNETASGLMPDLSSLPFANWLPTPDELVESTLGFTKSLVESQKDYCVRVRDELVRPGARRAAS